MKKYPFKRGEKVESNHSSILVNTMDDPTNPYGRVKCVRCKSSTVYTVKRCFPTGSSHKIMVELEELEGIWDPVVFHKHEPKVPEDKGPLPPFVQGNKIVRITADAKKLLKKGRCYTVRSCYFDAEPGDFVVTLREIPDKTIVYDACNFKGLDESDEGFKIALRDNERMLEL